jgi:uncharacterized protein YndB with AHSA1/START domain
MRDYRREVLISAPVDSVWELVGDPDTYAGWWPRVVEVKGERFEEGSEFIQVTRGPLGKVTTRYSIDELDDPRHIRTHCHLTGVTADWRLTGASDNTFVEVTFGADPPSLLMRAYSETFGRSYVRRWMDATVDALEEAVGPTT